MLETTKAEIDERQKFSSNGRTYWLILRGRWGLNIDRHIVRWTGFSLITWQYAMAKGGHYRPVIMLTTIGKISGTLRVQVLPYTEWQDSLIIVGSNGGGPKDPSWVTNLRADPHCWIRHKRRSIPVLARVSQGEERAALIEHVAQFQPFVRNYDTETARNGRELPLVVLTPRTAFAPKH